METTKNDYGQQEGHIAATLVSVENKVSEFKNDNKTKFRNCTIKFIDDYDKERFVSAIVYEKSYQQGMTIGEKYSATMRFDGNNIFTSIGHLAPFGERVNASMFKLEEVTQDVKDTIESKEKKMS